MIPVIVYIIIIIGMNVVDNLNFVQVINKPCVCSRTMRLSTFCSLRRDQEQFDPSQLTWNPPCCDRIRPPRSWVARKLTPHFPHLAYVAPYPKSRPPGVFQIQIYIHQDDIANPTHKLAYSQNINMAKWPAARVFIRQSGQLLKYLYGKVACCQSINTASGLLLEY